MWTVIDNYLTTGTMIYGQSIMSVTNWVQNKVDIGQVLERGMSCLFIFY